MPRRTASLFAAMTLVLAPASAWACINAMTRVTSYTNLAEWWWIAGLASLVFVVLMRFMDTSHDVQLATVIALHALVPVYAWIVGEVYSNASVGIVGGVAFCVLLGASVFAALSNLRRSRRLAITAATIAVLGPCLLAGASEFFGEDPPDLKLIRPHHDTGISAEVRF